MQFDIIDIEDLPLALYKIRNEKKMSQKDLCQKSNVSAIEAGKRPVSIKLFRELFSKLGYEFKICLIKKK
jgi:transcriptional regulator with XRE-family HTH domain